MTVTPTGTSNRHVLTAEDRQKAVSFVAREKRRQTLRANAEARQAYAREAYEWGKTVGLISREIGISEATIWRWVAGTSRPRYGRGVIECHHEPPHQY